MEDTTTRAISIGAGIFATIIIVTLTIASFSEMKEIMGLTKNTDTSIHSTFDNEFSNIYSKYNGQTVNGMDLLNLIKRYEDDPMIGVEIVYPQRVRVQNMAKSNSERESYLLNDLMKNGTYFYGYRFGYNENYNVTVQENSGKIKINFN